MKKSTLSTSDILEKAQPLCTYPTTLPATVESLTNQTCSQTAFYSATAGFVSTLYAPLDVYVYIYSPHRLIFSLVGAAVMTLTWVCQIGFWMSFEILSRDHEGLQS